jgi:integrase
MSLLLNESIRRGFADSNPCRQVDLPPLPVARKPEITDAEVAQIRAALVGRPEWMRISFEIALHQGCRLSETRIPLDQVDVDRRTITFAAKGRRLGGRHVFVARLHGALVPLILRLRGEGRLVTCELPRGASSSWHHFFRQIGLDHLCFHCTRVTTITRLARAQVPIAQAMAYVGHVSRAVHQIYQRLVPADLAGVESALNFEPAQVGEGIIHIPEQQP